jgi:hypothetical protein
MAVTISFESRKQQPEVTIQKSNSRQAGARSREKRLSFKLANTDF